MTQFTLAQALNAQAALRSAAGEGEETFSVQQLVGMLSDEIRVLRANGSSDEDIASLLKGQGGVELAPAAISQFYVDTNKYGA